MHLTQEQLALSRGAAARFGVTLQRLTSVSETATSWLVRANEPSTLSGEERTGNERGELYTLMLLSSTCCHEAALAFSESLSSDVFESGSIVDMMIDDEHGSAYLFEYHPRVSLQTLWSCRDATLAEMATALIAILAISVRMLRLGYCLGEISLDQLGVDRTGAMMLLHPGDMHAGQRAHPCCERGVATQSVTAILDAILATEDARPLKTVAVLALEQELQEDPLEVGLHAVAQVITPSRIYLSDSIEKLNHRMVRRSAAQEPLQSSRGRTLSDGGVSALNHDKRKGLLAVSWLRVPSLR